MHYLYISKLITLDVFTKQNLPLVKIENTQSGWWTDDIIGTSARYPTIRMHNVKVNGPKTP